MDNARIKNYILIVLALVNVFLLAIVLTNVRQAARAAASRKQALETVLTQNGVTLADGIELAQDVPAQLTLRRDTARETEMVSALLGETDVTDLGGNVYYYKGKNGGEAKFRGTGEFTILPAGDIARGSDAVKTAREMLKKLGLTVSSEAAELGGSDGDQTVTLTCAWKDAPVYNARVSFYFTATTLRLITGTRPFDVLYETAAPGACRDGVTVLMDFLQSLRASGGVCSEIRGLDVGYFAGSSVSGDSTLRPTWRVRTESGTYYIDAETGKAQTLEAA